jgi:hypothetical protein
MSEYKIEIVESGPDGHTTLEVQARDRAHRDELMARIRGGLDAPHEQTAKVLDRLVAGICAHSGSSSPSKHHLDAGTLDWIARCLRDGMTEADAIADAWEMRQVAP